MLQSGTSPAILIAFVESDAAAFAKLTQANIEKPLACFLGERLLAAPLIIEAIRGGLVEIPSLKGQDVQAIEKQLKRLVVP